MVGWREKATEKIRLEGEESHGKTRELSACGVEGKSLYCHHDFFSNLDLF